MEENQREHILKNLSLLVDSTTCNAALLSRLLAKRVLANADIYELESISNKQGRSRRLYRLVETRCNSYHILIQSLQDSEQEVAARILECLYFPHSPSSISVEEHVKKRMKTLLSNWNEGDASQVTENTLIWFDVIPPVNLFTGRKPELNQLHNKIFSNPGKPLVITQPFFMSHVVGIGKTELVRKYLQEYKNLLNDVIWINAATKDLMTMSFQRLAKDELEITTKDANHGEKDIMTIVKETYKFFEKRNTLFIFDHAVKSNHLKEFMPLRSLPPEAKKPLILIISHDHTWPREMNLIAVAEMSITDTLVFIKKGLEIDDNSQDEDIKLLGKHLDYIPGAIHQAISFIKDQCLVGKYRVKDYLEEYEHYPKELVGSDEGVFFTRW